MIKRYTNIQAKFKKHTNLLRVGMGLFFVSMSPVLFSQNIGFNLSGSTPSANAILDLNTGNSNNLGLIVPNVSLTALGTFNPPIANAATAGDVGMMVYNTNSSVGNGVGYYYWNGSTWVSVAGSGGGGGNVNACGGALTNYIPYFTSSTIICNSVIYQASPTTVGMGTTTPQNMLDVNGAMAIGTYAGNNVAPAGTSLIASGQVGIGTNTPNASALLDLTATTMGMLVPRMTTAQISAMPNFAVGLVVYNTTTNCFEYNTNGTTTGWVTLACSCSSNGGAPGAPGVITPTNVCLGTVNQVISTTIDNNATYYTWTVPSMVGTWSGQGTPSITVNNYTSPGSGNFTVTASNACGSSAATTQSFTVFTGNPTGSLSSATSICSSTGSTVTITGLGNYATIIWSAPTTLCSPTVLATANNTNATSLNLSGGTGGTGVVTATISNPCGSIVTSTSPITCYNGNPIGLLAPTPLSICSPATGVVTIFGLSNYASIVWSAPATICSAPVITAANAANSNTGATSVTLDGGTYGGSGTLTATMTNTCGTTTATATVFSSSGSPTGSITPASTSYCGPNTDVVSNSFSNYSTIVWSAPTTICSASVVAAANAANAGFGATSLTLSGGTGGTGTVTATASNGCGSISSTTASITYTTPTITQDAKAESVVDANTFTITTTQANDLVIVACDGYSNTTPPTTAVTTSPVETVTKYTSLAATDCETIIYWFVAPTAGSYTVTVTESTFTKYANYGIALTGFCTVPTANDLVTNNPISKTSGATSLGTTLSEIAGSYAIGSSTNYNNANVAAPGWTNLTSIYGLSDAKDNYGIAGQAIGAAGTPTITDTQGSNFKDAVLILIDIQ